MCALVGMLGAALPATNTAAQGRPAEETSARPREANVATLAERWRTVAAQAARAEVARRERFNSVSVTYGVLRLAADSSLAPLVTRAAGTASEILEATYGGVARDVMGAELVARRGAQIEGRDSVRFLQLSWSNIRPGDAATSMVIDDPVEGERQLVRAIGLAVAPRVYARLDTVLQRWLRSPIPAGPELADEREIVYVELATASTPGSRRCLGGDLDGCREYLGMRPSANPVGEGLTPVLRRRLIAERPSLRLRWSGASSAYDPCVLSHDDAACITAARGLPSDVVDAAISPTNARRSFVRRAIAEGGRGAFDRLRASAGQPIEARLAAVGGQSADSLIARWRADVLGARPTDLRLSPGLAAMTLLWILAVGAVALGSTRWR